MDCCGWKIHLFEITLNNGLYIVCNRDFQVSSVIKTGESIPTEVFIFSTADDACEYCIVELFVFLHSLTLLEQLWL